MHAVCLSLFVGRRCVHAVRLSLFVGRRGLYGACAHVHMCLHNRIKYNENFVKIQLGLLYAVKLL